VNSLNISVNVADHVLLTTLSICRKFLCFLCLYIKDRNKIEILEELEAANPYGAIILITWPNDGIKSDNNNDPTVRRNMLQAETYGELYFFHNRKSDSYDNSTSPSSVTTSKPCPLLEGWQSATRSTYVLCNSLKESVVTEPKQTLRCGITHEVWFYEQYL
jgi:hypothetical protein